MLLSLQRLRVHAGLWHPPHDGCVVSARHPGHELWVRPRAVRDPKPMPEQLCREHVSAMRVVQALCTDTHGSTCMSMPIARRVCMSCWGQCMSVHQCRLHFILDYRGQLTELMDMYNDERPRMPFLLWMVRQAGADCCWTRMRRVMAVPCECMRQTDEQSASHVPRCLNTIIPSAYHRRSLTFSRCMIWSLQVCEPPQLWLPCRRLRRNTSKRFVANMEAASRHSSARPLETAASAWLPITRWRWCPAAASRPSMRSRYYRVAGGTPLQVRYGEFLDCDETR